jgi:N6-L-threonylcarbamoyladenine synthase
VSGPLTLAIETSCDETAAAILRGEGELLYSETASQADLHREFGGVIPELASRHHLLALRPLLQRASRTCALQDLDCIAACRGPGLLSSLLVGFSAGKTIAIALRRPFLGINHLEGHLLSPFFGDGKGPRRSIGLIVSGGHTLLVRLLQVGQYTRLGSTLDDAAGEAFDKVAKLLGLGYPGGPLIDRLSSNGDRERFALPRSMLKSGDANFSFSGLKTAVRYLLPKVGPNDTADVCASFQEAVVDVLIQKTLAAAKAQDCDLITVSGGVSCNSRLRKRMSAEAARAGLELKLAEPFLTTDNAAMIAYAAAERRKFGEPGDLSEDADPSLGLGG